MTDNNESRMNHPDAESSLAFDRSWKKSDTVTHNARVFPAAGPYHSKRGRAGVDDTWEIVTNDGKLVASYHFWDEHDGESQQIEANFRLLAAAPELFAALEQLVAMARDPALDVEDHDITEALDHAASLLAKVRGG